MVRHRNNLIDMGRGVVMNRYLNFDFLSYDFTTCVSEWSHKLGVLPDTLNRANKKFSSVTVKLCFKGVTKR